MNTLIDGHPTDRLPADDRSLMFGESVFETVAFQAGRAPLWDRHLARLAQGAAALGLAMPERLVLERECQHLLETGGASRAVIRITLTGGSGGHGYWPAATSRPRRIVARRNWPTNLEHQAQHGLSVIVSSYEIGLDRPLVGLKHGNRLLQTLAARECLKRGAEEALLLDHNRNLAEAISSNLVLVTGSRLMTPERAEVAGVGLAWLSEVLGEELEVGSLSVDQLETLSEVLMINSIGGIRPVIAVEEKRFACGPVCRRLQSIWHKELFPCA